MTDTRIAIGFQTAEKFAVVYPKVSPNFEIKYKGIQGTPGADNTVKVRVATTANIALTGIQTIDGIALVAGDRVLVRAQSTASQNGVYTVQSGAWLRAQDEDTSPELAASIATVNEGTTFGGTMWRTDFKSTQTIGTNAVNWYLVPGATGTGTAGQVLASSGGATQTWTTLTLDYIPDAWVKRSVKVATTANITLSGTQTIDGVAVVAGDRVLVRSQTTASQNGIYIVASGAWTRSTDGDTSSKMQGAQVAVDQGTANGGLSFITNFKTTDTLNTTNMSWWYAPRISVVNAGGIIYGVSTGVITSSSAGLDGQILESGAAASPRWYTPTTKKIVKAATTADIVLSAPQTIDGISIIAGDRVLVKDQVTASQNGIYLCAAGAWTRALDADTSAEIAAGCVAVDQGTVNGGTEWTNYFKSTDTIGTTNMNWYRIQDSSRLGVAGGIATLDGTGKLTSAQLQVTTLDVILPDAWVKRSVKCATTANIALDQTTTTVDGVTLVTGDRVLVKNQTTQSQNGIYIASTVAAWVRSTDADTISKLAGAWVEVDQGTNNGGYVFQTPLKTTDVLGTTSVPFYIAHTTRRAVQVTEGGTGLTASVQGGIPYGTSTTAMAFLAAGTAGTVFHSGGTGAPYWAVHSDKTAVVAATTANITLSAAQTIDGVAVTAGQRVLVKDQTTASQNGIYDVAAGAWVRSGDANTASQMNGAHVPVGQGTVNAGRYFRTNFKSTDTLGTTNMNWYEIVDYSDVGAASGVAGLSGAGLVPAPQLGTGTPASNTFLNGVGAWVTLPPASGAGDVFGPASAGDSNIVLFDTTTGKAIKDSGITIAMLTSDNGSVKPNVAAATTANITLSGTQTVDSVALVAGDRVLVKNQTTASQNGIYVVAAGAWTRSADADTAAEISNAFVAVLRGGQAGRIFHTNFNPTNTLDTTSMSWYEMLDGLSSLDATKLTGTIADARLPARLGTVAQNESADFNNLTTNGLFAAVNTAVNAPTAGQWWFVQVIAYSNGVDLKQIAWKLGNTDEVWMRQRYAGPTWSAWVRCYFSATEMDARYLRIGNTFLTDLPDAWVKRSVKVATTANITLSGTQTIDGVAVAANDRVLVKDQTTNTQNGIYVVAAGAWTRATDADTIAKIAGSSVVIDSGTQGGRTYKNYLKTTDTLGATGMPWYYIFDNSSVVSLANGGTNASLTPVAGGVAYSTASALALSAVGVAGQVLISSGATAPFWITPFAKGVVQVATTANITLSGTQTIDGVAVAAGNRVLVKDQTTPSQNGVYDVAAGAWTRSYDHATASMCAGSAVAVQSGTVGAGKIFHTDFPSGGTVGTTNMSWYEVYDSKIRGAANGLASLDGSTLVPTGLLATGTANGTSYLRGDRTWAALPVSDTVTQGLVELATVAEAQAGVDTVRAVTPAGVAGYASNAGLISQTTADGRYAPLSATINAQTASYTLVLTDAQKLVTYSSASAGTLTVPPNSSVAFPIGTYIEITNLNTGDLTITPGAGVTINSPSGLKLIDQYATGALRKIATDTWILMGRTSV